MKRGSGEEEEMESRMDSGGEEREPGIPDHFWPLRGREKPHHIQLPALYLPGAIIQEALRVRYTTMFRYFEFLERALMVIPKEVPRCIHSARLDTSHHIHTFLSSQPPPSHSHSFLEAVLLLAHTTFLLRYLSLYNDSLARFYPSLLMEAARPYPARDFFLALLTKLWASSLLLEFSLSHLNFLCGASPKALSHVHFEEPLALMVEVQPHHT